MPPLLQNGKKYCDDNGFPRQATTSTYSNFIAFEYERDLSYTYLRSYRPALIEYIKFVDMDVITKLLKGIHDTRPPTAKYCAIWDVNLVLSFLSAMRVDCLKDLSCKTVTLLILLSGNGVNMISHFRISNMTLSEEECNFVFTEVLKHTGTEKAERPMTFRAFPDDPSLCPVRTMLACYGSQDGVVRGRPCLHHYS